MAITVVTAIIGLSVALLGMVLKKESGASADESQCKRNKVEEVSMEASCMMLPDDLIINIAERLNTSDLRAFGGVCKRWQSLFKAKKCAYLKVLSPLAVIQTSYAKKSARFVDIFSCKTLRAKTPDFREKVWVGCSSGYLIMFEFGNPSELSIWNPLTGENYSFSYPLRDPIARVIVVPLKSPLNTRRFLLVAKPLDSKSLVFISTGNHVAVTAASDDGKRQFRDFAYFKGRVYVVDNCGRLGLLEKGCPKFFDMDMSKFIGPHTRTRELHLVSGEDRLILVDTTFTYKIYEFDFERMRWEVINDLGDSAIFLSKGGSGLRNTSMWEGQSNRVYRLDYDNKLTVYSLDNKSLSTSAMNQRGYAGSLLVLKSFWYLRHESCCAACPRVDHDEYLHSGIENKLG